MENVNYFWFLLCMCVTTPLFYILAGILSAYGIIATGFAAVRATPESRLSGGLFVPLLIGMLSLLVGTVYQESYGDVAFHAQIANLALRLLTQPA